MSFMRILQNTVELYPLLSLLKGLYWGQGLNCLSSSLPIPLRNDSWMQILLDEDGSGRNRSSCRAA